MFIVSAYFKTDKVVIEKHVDTEPETREDNWPLSGH
jgi:hypothetical protein